MQDQEPVKFDLGEHIASQDALYKHGVKVPVPSYGNLELRILAGSSDKLAAVRTKELMELKERLGRDPEEGEDTEARDNTIKAAFVSMLWDFIPDDEIKAIIEEHGGKLEEDGSFSINHDTDNALSFAIFDHVFGRSKQFYARFAAAIFQLERSLTKEISEIAKLGKD